MGVHGLPGPHSPGTSLEETRPGRWETGPGWREKCPEKRRVPVGSRDVCSTVHGSYQLSTDPQPCPTTAGHPAQPGLARPGTHMHAGWPARPCSAPLGTRSQLVPILARIKPKENINCLKYPHPQILHAILGQMNKQILLLLTFMQNNRGRGDWARVWLHPWEGQPPGTQDSLSPYGPGPSGYMCPSSGLGWDTLQPEGRAGMLCLG